MLLLRVVAFVPSFDRSGCFCCIMVAACGCWPVSYARSDINRREIEDREDQIKYSTCVPSCSVFVRPFVLLCCCSVVLRSTCDLEYISAETRGVLDCTSLIKS